MANYEMFVEEFVLTTVKNIEEEIKSIILGKLYRNVVERCYNL